MTDTTEKNRYIRFFSQIGIGDVPLVGGKNASLGEMISQLTASGVRVPGGFATTAHAYREFLKQDNLAGRIADLQEQRQRLQHNNQQLEIAIRHVLIPRLPDVPSSAEATYEVRPTV